MFRPYLEEEIKMYQSELKTAIADQDEKYILECQEDIAALQAQDRPFVRIWLTNEITIATLKKIIRNMPFNLDRFAEMSQPMENLDNGFITEDLLNKIISGVFNKKANGKYPNSTITMFGHQSKADFILSKLQELI